jgi:peptidoglycan/xylan/chitin deacetylase (PgdA/CDA1 family)
MTFGSHSCSHRLLTRLSKKEVREEAARSYKELRKSGAAIVPVFCYPNGNYDAGVQEAVKDEGYQAALSVVGGVEGRQPSDLFALKRISLHNDMSNTRSLFALALSGFR